MVIFKCKMCGGDIEAQEKMAFGTCSSCGITSTLPKASDEKIVNLFNRANHFRRLNEFDKALAVYETILNEDNTNAEAHWCAVLCRYGIEYVEDPKTHERSPTCHRTQYASILTDADYLAATENAPDSYTRSLYETEAKKISEIQKNILAISKREKPFDIFICYKETSDGGTRTKDSIIAQDIYYQLKDDYRVFFSKITLEDKLGQEYEPYIFSALNSAKVMLVIGTRKEYFEAIWVRNEWSRFLTLMKNDRSRLLIPCYRDMEAYDLPDELAMYQSQDMSKIGFLQDLIRGIKKILDAGKTNKNNSSTTIIPNVSNTAESLLKRAFIFLNDEDWKQADEYCERVLDTDPENAKAYIGKLCAKLKLKHEENLHDCDSITSSNTNFQKALNFASPDYKHTLSSYAESMRKNDQVQLASKKAENISSYNEAIQILMQLKGFKNADTLMLSMENDIKNIAESTSKSDDIIKIIDLSKVLLPIGSFGGAEQYAAQLKERAEGLITRTLDNANELLTKNTFNDIEKAIKIVEPIKQYNDDAKTLANNLHQAYEKLKQEKLEQEQKRLENEKQIEQRKMEQIEQKKREQEEFTRKEKVRNRPWRILGVVVVLGMGVILWQCIVKLPEFIIGSGWIKASLIGSAPFLISAIIMAVIMTVCRFTQTESMGVLLCGSVIYGITAGLQTVKAGYFRITGEYFNGIIDTIIQYIVCYIVFFWLYAAIFYIAGIIVMIINKRTEVKYDVH